MQITVWLFNLFQIKNQINSPTDCDRFLSTVAYDVGVDTFVGGAR